MAGSGLTEVAPITYPVNALVSFHYYANVDLAEMQSWGLRMIGDSGAFSAASLGKPVEPDALWEWLDRWRDNLIWGASLDVIGDAAATWDYWINAPTHLKLVPTVHYGAEPQAIDRYVERGADLIGLGGMVPFKSQPDRLMRWCLSVMRYARDNHPHVRFHGWGVTHPGLLQRLPWWSVDSSGFGAGYRYGRLHLYDPTRHKKVVLHMNGKETAAGADLLRRYYGVSWRDVLTSGPQNRALIIRIAMRAMQLMENDLRRKHRVSPPPSLATTYTDGTQVHYVDSQRTNFAEGLHLHYADASAGKFHEGIHIHTAHATDPKDYRPIAAQIGGEQTHRERGAL